VRETITAECDAAAVDTRVAVGGVSVIAGLSTCPDCAVATCGWPTLRVARVGLDGVGIIAELDATQYGAVSAESTATGVGARVTIVCVSVVTLFARFDAAISACRLLLTAIAAAVAVNQVAVVTFLDAELNDSVSAGSEKAAGETRVAVVQVTVVTALTVIDDPVATRTQSARVATVVSTVAGFDVEANKSVATRGCRAVVQTRVPGVPVGIVTFLAGLDIAISTARIDATRQTCIGVVEVAVITEFSRLNDAVSADR
jgi:hypothetical protein